MLDRLVSKIAAQRTSQPVKWISRARDMNDSLSLFSSYVHRSIARSVAQSPDRSIARSRDRSIARSLGLSVNHSIARSIARSLGRSVTSKTPPSVSVSRLKNIVFVGIKFRTLKLRRNYFRVRTSSHQHASESLSTDV